ncbi:MAG: 30S ribosomal protein S15 [Candidatus Dojkabacteria bacterium]|nr:MAG: 30S ribosomal protein S15 [Candidatus Dojkabacteria bacterium]
MALKKGEKTELITKFALSDADTGSPEVQIALLTARIQKLTAHFEKHGKDFHSKRGFIKLVKNRQRLLAYLKREDEKRYAQLIEVLGLRK